MPSGDEPETPERTIVSYRDSQGRETGDPAQAVSGEIAEYRAHGRLRRRTRFFLQRAELPWLPVSEAAFLLWVLALLVFAWLVAAFILFVL